MIKVVNGRNYSGNGEWVDRRSVLGNPFYIGKDGNRKEVIGKYKKRLWNEIKKGNDNILKELDRLIQIYINEKVLVLKCWCKPKDCHADVIKDCLEWMIETGNEDLRYKF